MRTMTSTNLGLVMLLLCAVATAQPAAPALGLLEYLEAVSEHNPDLQSQHEAVRSARAGVSIAGTRPDPTLSLGIDGKELSQAVSPKPPYGRTLGINIPIELGGKRSKRVAAAEAAVRLAQATAQGAKRQLFADASAAFAEACRSRDALQRQQQSLAALSDVVRANELRRKAGDLGGLELLQSRTGRDRFQADVAKARADFQAASIGLSVPLGQRFGELFGQRPLDCSFAAYEPGGSVQALVDQAAATRDDVQLARATLETARANADLVRANRWVDPSVGIGVNAKPGVAAGVDADGNPVGGTPRSRALTVTVSIPIPVSRVQHGELVQADAAVTQATLALTQTELKAEADVRAAYARFEAARENVGRYRDSVLSDSDKVLEGMRLSYRKGAASLLELLAAHQAADSAHLGYLQAVADLAQATVRLQLSIGQAPSL